MTTPRPNNPIPTITRKELPIMIDTPPEKILKPEARAYVQEHSDSWWEFWTYKHMLRPFK